MSRVRLTNSVVDRLPLREVGQKLIFDETVPGFGICIGKTTKTYFAQKQIGHRTVRVKIGRHGIFAAEQARKEARDLLVRMAKGENPNSAKQQARQKGQSLQEALETYLAAKSHLREGSRKTYRRTIELYLKDWASSPLGDINPQMIIQKHAALISSHGGPTANNVMRVLRAIINYSAAISEEFGPNPVTRLSQTKNWATERRRQTVIKRHELAAWYNAVLCLDDAGARDFLLLLLFTGMRRSEGLRLKWEDVDLHGRILTVPETKNGDPLILPIPKFLHQLLTKRHAARGNSKWVFPSHGATGHMVEPKKFIARVRKTSGVNFILHDLRRTFLTVAEALDISPYALKRLINHRVHHDVTAGYLVFDIERLRAPMEAIATELLKLATSPSKGIKEPEQISNFKKKQNQV